MAAHRYWRIYVTANNYTGNSTGFREIELRESISGADATGSGTAAADSSFSGSFLPAKAFDNGTGEWASGTGALPHWISYDFGAGADKDIVEVAWIARAAAVGQEPVDFDFQWSDDNAAWTTLFSVRGYSEQKRDGTTWYAISANTGIMAATTDLKEGWRINVTATDGGTVADIAEIQMRLTAGGADQCTGGAAFASTAYDGSAGTPWGASYAFDDNPAAPDWSTNSGIVAGWVAYQFPSAKDITEIAITSRDEAALFNQAPKDFTVEYWDGSAWVVAMTLTGITGWTRAQTRYFNASGETSGLPPAAARPVVFVTT